MEATRYCAPPGSAAPWWTQPVRVLPDNPNSVAPWWAQPVTALTTHRAVLPLVDRNRYCFSLVVSPPAGYNPVLQCSHPLAVVPTGRHIPLLHTAPSSSPREWCPLVDTTRYCISPPHSCATPWFSEARTATPPPPASNAAPWWTQCGTAAPYPFNSPAPWCKVPGTAPLPPSWHCCPVVNINRYGAFTPQAVLHSG